MNSKPILYIKKEECCGCAACATVCPKNAIVMEKDIKGFAYPVVKGDCVFCQQCIKVCPLKV